MTIDVEAPPRVTTAADLEAPRRITTIIFDIDDTCYDVSTGFTTHRNTDGAVQFMMQKLHFPDAESAQALRDEYFERYHSTAKALQVAEVEGRLPPPPAGVEVKSPRFHPEDLSEFWAENLDFSMLGGVNADLVSMLRSLKSSNPDLNLVAFSNGPRKYVLRVIKTLGIDEFFTPDMVFSTNDVLPYTKPEPDSFREVLRRVGNGSIKPDDCVMVEDSMKNIRVAKGLGMKTVLVAGKGRLGGDLGADAEGASRAKAAEATKPGDAPKPDDPAVDVAIEVCTEMRSAVPGLWRNPPTFSME